MHSATKRTCADILAVWICRYTTWLLECSCRHRQSSLYAVCRCRETKHTHKKNPLVKAWARHSCGDVTWRGENETASLQRPRASIWSLWEAGQVWETQYEKQECSHSQLPWQLLCVAQVQGGKTSETRMLFQLLSLTVDGLGVLWSSFLAEHNTNDDWILRALEKELFKPCAKKCLLTLWIEMINMCHFTSLNNYIFQN